MIKNKLIYSNWSKEKKSLIHFSGSFDFGSEDDADEGTQATNINELFDFALELLWTLVTKNGWDQTKLPDISEGFSYVSCQFSFIYFKICWFVHNYVY